MSKKETLCFTNIYCHHFVNYYSTNNSFALTRYFSIDSYYIHRILYLQLSLAGMGIKCLQTYSLPSLRSRLLVYSTSCHSQLYHRIGYQSKANSEFHSRPMSSRSTPNSPSRATPPPVNVRFAISRVPRNPLGESNYIRTAAALIIGCVLRNLQAYTL